MAMMSKVDYMPQKPLTYAEFTKKISGQFDGVKTDPYNQWLAPFRILGNLYYVGDKLVCMHLIDTGEGLILIDTGFPGCEAMLINAIWTLGFNTKDIKLVLHTHGHVDHCGATKFFQKVCKSKAYLGEADAKLFIDYPEDFVWDGRKTVFTPDGILKDGDKISLGNTIIDVVASPGHSPGAVSFFFNVEVNGKVYRAALPGGIGRNTLFKQAYESLHYPDTTPQDFLNSMDRLMEEDNVTLWLGSHPSAFHNDGLRKREKMLANPDGPNPFIVTPDEWLTYLREVKDSMAKIVENGCI